MAALAIVGALGSAGATAAGEATALAGRWDATVVVNGVEVPFLFEIAGDQTTVSGSFFNGDRRITSTAGKVENGVLSLSFDQYAAKLEATEQDGALAGEYRRGTRAPYPFKARRAAEAASAAFDAPSIDGTWIVGGEEHQGRIRVALHRQADGRAGDGHDSPRRW